MKNKTFLKRIISSVLRPISSAGGIIVLMYHCVSEEEPYDGIGISINTDTFDCHMRYLKDSGFSAVSLREAFAKRDFSGKSIVITFDDGYENTLTCALPVMKKYGFRGTCFVTSGFIKDNNVSREGRRSPGWIRRYLTLEQMRRLHAEGIEIGAHTVSHPDLSTLKDEDKRREIIESKRMLEETLGEEVLSFAYPYGKYDRYTVEIVKGVFRYACTITYGAAGPFSDPHLIPRRGIYASDRLIRDFDKKINGAYDWLNLINRED